MIRECRVCGCTDDRACAPVGKPGLACSWVEWDLCSACLPVTFGSGRRGVAAFPIETATFDTRHDGIGLAIARAFRESA